jgi:hypothetical protein
MHFPLYFFKVKSALFPKTRPNAPNIIDLPAPVSPVIMKEILLKNLCLIFLLHSFFIERVIYH